MKTAIITGVTGQDGSYLAELLLDKGYKVVGLKRRTSIISTNRIDHIFNDERVLNFYLQYANMNDSGCLHRILQEHQPDEIYNLAGQSHVRVSFETPYETAEYVGMGTLNLLEAARNVCPNAKIYQASSSEMFGDNPEFPQDENTKFMPASPYACSKAFAHYICNNYRKSYNMHISCGILFNHESPRRGETFVTRKITMAAARIKLGLQQVLELGNLDSKRDWGYAGDYVEAMWKMLQQDNPDDYVIATGETHTVREFLHEVFNIAELDVSKYVKINERLFRPHEVPVLLGSPIKARNILDWQPKTNFKQLAKLMYEEDFKKLSLGVKNEIK